MSESIVIKKITGRTFVCPHYAKELMFSALYNNEELMSQVLEEIDADLKDNEFYKYNPHEARLRRYADRDLSDIDFSSKTRRRYA